MFSWPCPVLQRWVAHTVACLGIRRTTFHRILLIFLKDTNVPRKRCDHGFEEIKIGSLHIFVGCICMSANTAPSLASWDRTGMYESGDVQASGTKGKMRTWQMDTTSITAVRPCPSRQVIHNNFDVVRILRSNDRGIHMYTLRAVCAICDSACEGDNDTDLCYVLALT